MIRRVSKARLLSRTLQFSNNLRYPVKLSKDRVVLEVKDVHDPRSREPKKRIKITNKIKIKKTQVAHCT